MKQLSVSPWLLAVAAFFSGAADAQHHPPGSVPKPAEKPGELEYPLFRPSYSSNNLNITRVRHVHKCLQDWCEDREQIFELGGKIRCRTDHDTGENYVGWICNLSYTRKTCSSAMLNLAASNMIGMMEGYSAWSPAGHIYYNPVHSDVLIIGWDTYCNGSPSCGQYRDPTVVCEDVLRHYKGGPAPKPPQFDRITNGYGSAHHCGYQDAGEEKSETSGGVHHGYIEESEDEYARASAVISRKDNTDDEEEFKRWQEKEAIRNIIIVEEPVKNKMGLKTQDLGKLSGANKHNEYHNPAHGKHS